MLSTSVNIRNIESEKHIVYQLAILVLGGCLLSLFSA